MEETYINPKLTIDKNIKCARCDMARDLMIMVNCCKCSYSYCFGFINHWNK